MFYLTNPIALNVFSDIWSAIKELFELWSDFFSNIGSLLSFCWNTILDWYKFGHVLSSALTHLPKLYDLLPDILIPFASGCLILSIILLLIGRNS